jgi:outer membrane immunogenic protein
MKQLIRLTILFCACAALALTVVAGPESLPSGKEMKQVAPAPLPECNWTGFYIGINVGGQFGHSEDTDDPGDPAGNNNNWNNPDRPWGYSESGVVAGGTVGYNHQWNWIVLGIEADGGYMNVDGSGREPGSPDTFGHTDSDFFTTVRGRLGIAMNTWMFYATGGGIGLNYEQRITDTDATFPFTGVLHNGRHQDFKWGYTVGGGIEKMFGCHWSIKAEYLYFAIDRNDFTALDASDNVYRFDGDTMGHIVRAGLNYKF